MATKYKKIFGGRNLESNTPNNYTIPPAYPISNRCQNANPRHMVDPYGFNTAPRRNRDPVYISFDRLWTQNYPRSNGTIGEGLFSGHPYYPKAY
jgi:hypothetical protein